MQVGAGIGSVLGRAAGTEPQQVKALVPVGAAAPIAAAFNTPIAAVMFSLEEIMGDLHAPVLGSVVLARRRPGWCCTCCWATIRCSTSRHINWSSGGVRRCTRCWAWRADWFRWRSSSCCWACAHGFCALPQIDGLVPTRRLAACCVGLMGWFVPQVMGVGYDYVGRGAERKYGAED